MSLLFAIPIEEDIILNIAFFGLGNMGFPIAKNLIANGHAVTTAIHRNEETAQRFQALGGRVAASPAEAVADAELIFTILPNDQALLSLLLSESLLSRLPAGSVLVEMTSASANAVREVSEAYAHRQVAVLDAPVSGGITGAANATMSMLCAGERAVYDRVQPVLEGIAGTLCYVGKTPGLGKMVKSLNNLLSAINKTAVGEAWQIAAANGIDPAVFLDAISASSGDSAALRAAFPRIRDNQYTAGFTVALMRKDLNLAMDLAEGLRLPLAETTLEYYVQAAAFDEEDSAAVAKVRYQDKTHT